MTYKMSPEHFGPRNGVAGPESGKRGPRKWTSRPNEPERSLSRDEFAAFVAAQAAQAR